MDTNATTARYSNKTLGIRNYEAEKDEFHLADFINRDELYDFLWEVSTGESDFTPAGIAFVKEYFDLEQLGHEYRREKKQLPPNGAGKTDAERVRKFVDYINKLEPMEGALFIAQSQYKDKSGKEDMPTLDSLNDKFLPPK